MIGSLTDIDYLKLLLGQAGVRPERSAGQNFLISEEVVEATLASLRGSYGRQAAPKYVTELGAGVGTLTQALVAKGFQVRAIERDTALAEILEKQIPKKLRGRLEIIVDDLRNVDWAPTFAKATADKQDKAYQLVGNIPYNLSGLIIRRITQLMPAPKSVVLLVQQEVADRLLAEPPDMNLLGLSVQLWGSATRLLNVPASCFWPQPQVDSSLVLLLPHPEAEQHVAEREQVLKVAKVAFQAKRKQLGGVLKRTYKASGEEVQRWLAAAGVTVQARAQELSPAAWQRLAAEVGKAVS